MRDLQSTTTSFVTPARGAAEPGLGIAWACSDDDLRAAQRLRHDVFAGEMAARLTVPPGTPSGHDADRFDAFCEHLLVRVRKPDGPRGEVIGTYRVLTPDGARRAGGWYGETEFDLSPIAALRERTVELGRSCVHADWRSGGVIMALWAALAGFMQRHRLDTMIGCASIGMRDGGHAAASLWHRLRQTHLADPRFHVRPRLALPVQDLRTDLAAEAPALVKGYLRCGAKVLGPPAWDPDFASADLPMMMRLDEMPARYRKHFLGD